MDALRVVCGILIRSTHKNNHYPNRFYAIKLWINNPVLDLIGRQLWHHTFTLLWKHQMFLCLACTCWPSMSGLSRLLQGDDTGRSRDALPGKRQEAVHVRRGPPPRQGSKSPPAFNSDSQICPLWRVKLNFKNWRWLIIAVDVEFFLYCWKISLFLKLAC